MCGKSVLKVLKIIFFQEACSLLRKYSLLADNLNVRVITPDILSDFLDGKFGRVKRV